MKTDRMRWKFLGPGVFDEETSDEVSVYLKERRESLLDQDALGYEEDGFMKGYEELEPEEEQWLDFLDKNDESV